MNTRCLFQTVICLSLRAVLFGNNCLILRWNLQPILQLDTGGLDMGYADKERGAEDSGGNWERSFGMIYVIALSPDDRFLAVGGVFSESTIENIDMGLIRRLTSLSKPLSVNKPPKGAFFTAEAARRTEMK